MNTFNLNLMREPNIRFFLSSTFADFQPERNAISHLFKRLKTEYSQKGWHIDLVDLRWGISQEATETNRTMDICLHELNMCMEMSPRPNFIVLLGERYGYIPLPSSLTEAEWDYYWSNAIFRQMQAMRACYHRDLNNLHPDKPSYFLRDQSQLDPDDVRTILAMLERHHRDLSATELEIARALSADSGDIPNRVIAYRRRFSTLRGMPEGLYADDHSHSQKALADKVQAMVPPDNLYARTLTPEQYSDNAYLLEFESQIEKRIRRLIEREIEYVAGITVTENQRHLKYAFDHSRLFVPLASGIEELQKYIEDTADGLMPFWLAGFDTGTGVTTLLSTLVAQYMERDGYEVIARFCGQTPLSSTPKALMDSIFDDIRRLAPGRKGRDVKSVDRVKSDYCALQLGYPESMCLGRNIKKLPDDRRILIVIDNLDMFANCEYADAPIHDLRWLAYDPLAPNVRIIVNTGSNKDYFLSPDYDRHALGQHKVKGYVKWFAPSSKMSLKGLEARFVTDCMSLMGRKISPRQLEVIDKIKEKPARMRMVISNQQPPEKALTRVELAAIARIFVRIKSYEESSWPYDNLIECTTADNDTHVLAKNDLLRQLHEFELGILSKPDLHGQPLVNAMVELLSLAPVGIPDSLMRKFLWQMPGVKDYVFKNTFHDNPDDELPPLYWSRMRYDYREWLTFAPSLLGPVNCLRYHDSQLVTSVSAISLMFTHVCDNWRHEPWSQYHLPWLLHFMSSHRVKTTNFIPLEFLQHVLTKPDYLAHRFALDGHAVTKDIDRCLSLARWASPGHEKIDRAALNKLRTEILLINRKMTAELFTVYARQQPSGSQLNQLFRNVPCPLLKDELKEYSISESILSVVGSGLRLVGISTDGTRQMLLDRSQRRMLIRSTQSHETITIDPPTATAGRILLWSHDDTLSCAALHYDDGYVTVCAINEGVLFTSPKLLLNPDRKIKFSAFSPDGKWFLFANDEELTFCHPVVPDKASEPLRLTSHATVKSKTLSVKFSPDSKYVWVQFIDRVMRWSLADFTQKGFLTNDLPEPSINPHKADSYRIVCASDSTVALLWGNSLVVSRRVSDMWHVASVYLPDVWIAVSALIPVSDPEHLYVSFEGGEWERLDLSDLSHYTQGYNFTVDVLTNDLHIAGSQSQGLVFDFYRASRCDYTQPDWMKNIIGINTVSADRGGNVIAITKGMNWRLQAYPDFNVFTHRNDKWEKHNIKIGAEGFICHSCAVSPDGRRLAVANVRNEIFELPSLRKVGQLESNKMMGCLQFSPDSKYLIASPGDGTTLMLSEFKIHDADGKPIREFSTFDDGACSNFDYPVIITPNNRFLLRNTGGIVDLVEGKEVRVNHAHDYHTPEVMLPERGLRWHNMLAALSPGGRYMYSKFSHLDKSPILKRLDLHTLTMEPLATEHHAMAITPDGRKLYVTDRKMHLHLYDLPTGSCVRLKTDEKVCAVFPTPDGLYIYFVTADGQVMFCDSDGQMIERALMPASKFALTAHGLAVGDSYGRVAMFAPSHQQGLYETVYAPSVRRYDLATRQRADRPTYVCPACGTLSASTLPHTQCPGCGRTVLLLPPED